MEIKYLRSPNLLLSRCAAHDLVNTIRVNHFEELMVVPIIGVNSHQHRPRCIKCFLQHRSYLVGSSEHESHGAERFSIFHVVDRTKIDSGFAAVFRNLLNANHVIGAVDPDHMDNV
jgi:hypothetical protein